MKTIQLKIKMFQVLFFVAMGLISPKESFGQTCYSDTRKEAINTFSRKDFKRAKQVFNAAKSCPDTPNSNDLNYWIKKCNNAMGSNTSVKAKELSFAQKMAQYESEGDWNEGLMPVTKKSDWKDESSNFPFDYPKIGFVNERGDLVIACQYVHQYSLPISFFSHMNRFHEGMAAVAKFFTDANGEYYYYSVGYIDKNGRTVLPFNYSFATIFSEGVAAVSEGDIYDDSPAIFFVDKKGNRIGDKSFHLVQHFQEGMCPVMKDSTSGWGFADKSGEIVIPCVYEKVGYFENGVAWVSDKSHHHEYALIDKAGSLVGNYQFRPECLEWNELKECISEYRDNNNERYFVALKEYEKRQKQMNDGEWKIDKYEAVYACELGECYQEGKGGAVKDINIAIGYWKMAAEYHPHSYFLLAFNYAKMEDYQQSRDCYFKLIDQQTKSNKKDYLATAYFNLGLQYYNGQGVTVDYKMAMDYFQKSKEAGGKSDCDGMIKKCIEKIERRNQ